MRHALASVRAPAALAALIALAGGCDHGWSVPDTCRVDPPPAPRPHAEAVVAAATGVVARSTTYLTCRGGRAALYRVTYADHDAAEASVGSWGVGLFGAAWTDESLPVAGIDGDFWIHGNEIAIASGPGSSDLALSLERAGYLDRVGGDTHDIALARQTTVDLDCSPASRDSRRAWCAVAEPPTLTFTAPAQATVRIGLSLHVRPGQTIRAALGAPDAELRVSTLALDATHAVLRDVIPQSADERAQLTRVTDSVRAVLEHRASRIAVSPALAKFVADQRTQVELAAETKRVGGGAVEIQGTLIARAYRGTSAYLVIEQAFDRGNWINLYPDVDLAPDAQ